MSEPVPNPAPKPLAMCDVRTDSGTVRVPCEPLSEYLAITPTFGMDEDGNSLVGGFTITHRPSGKSVVGGDGCIHCARLVGRALIGFDADWSALTEGGGERWLATLSERDRAPYADYGALDWLCDAEPCHEEAADA